MQNQYFDFLIDRNFQRVNSLFLLSFENENDRESYSRYYLPTVEIIIDGKNVFDKTVTNGLRTIDKIRNIATAQDDDYTTGCLLDYPYFRKCYKLTAIDLRKQQKLLADPKGIEKVNFTVNLNREEAARRLFITEEVKE